MGERHFLSAVRAMNHLTTPNTQESRYQHLKATIIKLNESAYEWGLALRDMRESKLYLTEADSFQEWCQKFCGKSADAVRGIIWRSEQKEARRLVESTTAEPIGPIGLITSQEHINYSSSKFGQIMSAHRDRTQPVKMGSPSTSDTVEITSKVEPAKHPSIVEFPPDARVMVHQALKLAQRLLKESGFALSSEFRHITALLEKVDVMIQPELFPTAPTKQKSRGSLVEVVTYFVQELKLPASDGEWFFSKAEGSGWKNNKVPIVDWRSTARAWSLAKYLPSQKQAAGNGKLNGAELMVRQKELERCEELMRNIRERYSSVDRPWSDNDKQRFQQTKGRRDELKKILGVQVT